MDEFVFPVNFDVNRAYADWCQSSRPPLVSFILNDMQITASRSLLDSYTAIYSNRTGVDCSLGYSYSQKTSECKPITAFTLPVYTWLQPKESTLPYVHSKYPSSYSVRFTLSDINGQHQTWKSVYQTKYNPLLIGRSLHGNHAPQTHAILAPRSRHSGLSLEIAHVRGSLYGRNKTADASVTVKDDRWRVLQRAYERCSA